MSPAQIFASALSPRQREAVLVLRDHPIWQMTGANAAGCEARLVADGIVTRVHYIGPGQQLSHVTMLVLTLRGFEVARLLTCPIEAELRRQRIEARKARFGR